MCHLSHQHELEEVTVMEPIIMRALLFFALVVVACVGGVAVLGPR